MRYAHAHANQVVRIQIRTRHPAPGTSYEKWTNLNLEKYTRTCRRIRVQSVNMFVLFLEMRTETTVVCLYMDRTSIVRSACKPRGKSWVDAT